MAQKIWLRLALSICIGGVLACLLGLQAASSALTRKAPELATTLWSGNGLAYEQLAFAEFAVDAAEGGDEGKTAARYSAVAAQGLRIDPLAPKSLAIFAMAAPSEAKRNDILNLGSNINRRDLALQRLVLRRSVDAAELPGAIKTLDQILRVHPEHSREFFPLLAQALAHAETVPIFVDILANESPWHDDLLTYAVTQKDSLASLGLLRRQITSVPENFDRDLIAGLARSGEADDAEDLYRRVTGKKQMPRAGTPLDWASQYPPFEWYLTDEPGLRAQIDASGNALEIAVRPGKGGALAARLVLVPQPPFKIRISHRISPANQLRDVRLRLVCPETAEIFFDERLSELGDGFQVDTAPSGCKRMLLAVIGRAWSGRSVLSGTIDSIELVPATAD